MDADTLVSAAYLQALDNRARTFPREQLVVSATPDPPHQHLGLGVLHEPMQPNLELRAGVDVHAGHDVLPGGGPADSEPDHGPVLGGARRETVKLLHPPPTLRRCFDGICREGVGRLMPPPPRFAVGCMCFRGSFCRARMNHLDRTGVCPQGVAATSIHRPIPMVIPTACYTLTMELAERVGCATTTWSRERERDDRVGQGERQESKSARERERERCRLVSAGEADSSQDLHRLDLGVQC